MLRPCRIRRATNVVVSKKRGEPAVNNSYSIQDESIVNWRKQRKAVAHHKQASMPRFEGNIQILPERKSKPRVEVFSSGATSSNRPRNDDFFFLDARFVGVRDNLKPSSKNNRKTTNAAVEFQQKFLRCKTSVDILQLVSDNLTKLDGIHLATALHRVAKFGWGRSNDTRLEQLLTKLGYIIHAIDIQGLSLVIWSLAKLQLTPAWIDNALTIANKNMDDFNVHQYCGLAYALPKFTTIGNVNQTLLEEVSTNVIRNLEKNVGQITSPRDIVYATSSFVRFQVTSASFFAQIANNSMKCLDSFNENSMCSLLWSFASSRFVDRDLFASCRNVLENGEFSQPHNLVMFAWALSVTHQADKNIFDALWPKYERLVSDMDARQTCSVFWAYDNATLLNAERLKFFETAVDTSQMSGHDIASTLPAYCRDSDNHLQFLSKIEKRIDQIFVQLSPTQVSSVTKCFGEMPSRAHRVELVQRLIQKALERPSQYKSENFIALLQGSKCLPHDDDLNVKLITRVMEHLSQETGKLSIPETIEMISIFSVLPQSTKNKFTKMPDNLLIHLYNVLNAKKSFTLPGGQFVNLLEALPTCGGRHNRLVELLTVRSAKMLRSAQFDYDLSGNQTHIGMRALSAFTKELDFAFRFRSVLHRKWSVAKVVQQVLASELSPRALAGRSAKSGTKGFDSLDYLQIGAIGVKLGFFGDEFYSVRSQILREELGPSWGCNNINRLGMKAWFLLECFDDDETKQFCRDSIGCFLENVRVQNLSVDGAQGEKLIDGLFRLAWAAAVIDDSEMTKKMFEVVSNLDVSYDKVDAKLAQQAASAILVSGLGVSTEVKKVIDKVNKLFRSDLYMVREQTQKDRPRLRELSSDQWVSSALQKMSLAHSSSAVLPTPLDGYRVATMFPLQKVCVLVHEFDNLVATYNPEGKGESKISTSAKLSVQHMERAGWKVAQVSVLDLFMARRGAEGGIVSCLARRLGKFLPGLESFVSEDDGFGERDGGEDSE